jgi:carboxyl-terminal processing protease
LKSTSHIRAGLLVLWLCCGSCFLAADLARTVRAQEPAATIAPVASPAPSPTPEITDAQKREQSFNIVWATINQFFYDPTFGGVDWNGARRRYEPLVLKAKSDAEVHQLLQLMVNELHQSHFLIIPPEAIPQVLDDEADDEEIGPAEPGKKEAAKRLLKGNAELTQKLVTGIGIDVRVIGNVVVVSRVARGSAAARAGLRPGFVIKKANGKSLERIIAETLQSPLYHAIIRPELPLMLVAGFINGPPGTSVRLEYLDGRNRPRTLNIKRERLEGEMSAPVGNLPAMYGEVESRRLRNGIGYLRFNAFVPPLMEKICSALRSMSDARGIVLDLRGNRGGLLGMLGGLSGLLNYEPVGLGFLETRGGRTPLYAFPQTRPFTGTLAILIDASTESAAEMFASGMQESHRATVVGETSAGSTLPSTIKELPTGALFQYAFANYHTACGTLLEGRGVKPDLEVKLSRKALLAGRDPQLEAAIRKVLEESRPRLITGPELIADVEASQLQKASPPEVTVVKPPPPPPRPLPTPENKPAPSTPPPDGMPTTDQILEKYIEAAGGKAAFEKLHNRVSKGRAELSTMGVSGALEIYEAAPNKLARFITVPGLGVMMRGNNDKAAWWQDSLQGYIELPRGPGFEAFRDGDFHKAIHLPTLFPKWEFKGKEKVGGRDVYVLQGAAQLPVRYYFDTETGLLLRQGNTFYEDYREVDGVKLPFMVREDSLLGVSFVYKITEIKHNVPIDEGKFAPYPSCFTNPDR